MRPGRRRWWRRTILLVMMWGILIGVGMFFIVAAAWAFLYSLSPLIEPGSK